MQAFRDWLRRRLDEMGWTNSDLERASGVSNSIIWRWLADPPRRPTPANLEKIAPHLGATYEDLMRMCGYLPGEPVAVLDARRQNMRNQVDRWLTAVGPDYEAYFWAHIKAQGDSTERLIRELRTAVNAVEDTAINPPVSDRGKRGRRPRKGGNGPLGIAQHGVGELLADRRIATGHHPMMADRRRAA